MVSGSAHTNAIVFARVPGTGPVKTRLARSLGERRARALYEACLLDALEGALAWAPGAVTLEYSPPAAGEELRTWLASRRVAPGDGSSAAGPGEPRFPAGSLRLRPQVGDSLGDRMAAALEYSFQEGFQRAILVGSDIPGMSRGLLDRAVALLDSANLVFGPSLDGGFYLVGATAGLSRHPVGGPVLRKLFDGVRWSELDTLAQVLERAQEMGLCWELAELWPDLDVAEDIPLVRRILRVHQAGGERLAPHLSPLLSD